MSDVINNGGPAFPVPDSNSHGHVECSYTGMTLRDYFAAKAMQGLMKSDPAWALEAIGTVSISEASYIMADAMIAARENKPA